MRPQLSAGWLGWGPRAWSWTHRFLNKFSVTSLRGPHIPVGTRTVRRARRPLTPPPTWRIIHTVPLVATLLLGGLLIVLARGLRRRVTHLEDTLMARLQEFDPILAQINATTNNIAADITRLAEQIHAGLAPAEVDALKASLTEVASQLEAVAAVTPEPGTPPVEPPGTPPVEPPVDPNA